MLTAPLAEGRKAPGQMQTAPFEAETAPGVRGIPARCRTGTRSRISLRALALDVPKSRIACC